MNFELPCLSSRVHLSEYKIMNMNTRDLKMLLESKLNEVAININNSDFISPLEGSTALAGRGEGN